MQSFLIGQKAVIYNQAGQILLLRRSQIKRMTRPGGLDLPGGALDLGESPTDGIRREIAEETGLHVAEADVKLIDVVRVPNGNPTIMIGYCTKTLSDQVQLSPEHMHYEWVSMKTFMRSPAPLIYKNFVECSVGIWSTPNRMTHCKVACSHFLTRTGQIPRDSNSTS